MGGHAMWWLPVGGGPWLAGPLPFLPPHCQCLHQWEEEEERGHGVGGRAGEAVGGVRVPSRALLPLVVLTVCLHRILTDGGKGRAGAKRLSPQAGRAGRRVLCGQGLYGEGAAAGGLAAGPPWILLPRNHGWGWGAVDAGGQESGQE